MGEGAGLGRSEGNVVVPRHGLDLRVAGEDLLEGVDDGQHILGAADPGKPRPGPLCWRLDGRHQGVAIRIGIGAWIGIDAQAQAEAARSVCSQLPQSSLQKKGT